MADWLILIHKHMIRYPAMLAQDVYKLIFQGVLGPEHDMPSEHIFTNRLKEELNNLQPDRNEPLLESIRPDNTLFRIYLRPWLASQQDISELVETCTETCQRGWGTKQELRLVWNIFLEQVVNNAFPAIDINEARKLDCRLQEDEFPAVHHSSVYSSTYHPAYRLTSLYPDRTQTRRDTHAGR